MWPGTPSPLAAVLALSVFMADGCRFGYLMANMAKLATSWPWGGRELDTTTREVKRVNENNRIAAERRRRRETADRPTARPRPAGIPKHYINESVGQQELVQASRDEPSRSGAAER